MQEESKLFSLYKQDIFQFRFAWLEEANVWQTHLKLQKFTIRRSIFHEIGDALKWSIVIN